MNLFNEENLLNDLTEEEMKDASDFIMYLKSKRPQITKSEDEIPDESLKTDAVIEKLLKKIEDLSSQTGQITKLKQDLIEKNETIKFWQDKYFELDSSCKLIRKENIELQMSNNNLLQDNKKLNKRIDIKIFTWLSKKLK